jgi:hypothetical protein
MKIIVNRCFGGFGLSPKAISEYLKLKGKECHFYKLDYNIEVYRKISIEHASTYDTSLTKDLGQEVPHNWDYIKPYYFYYNNIERNDPDLVKVVESIGVEEASGKMALLEVVEIPDDVQWEIDNYDGSETIHEVHRSW